jgi:hypothetical protein
MYGRRQGPQEAHRNASLTAAEIKIVDTRVPGPVKVLGPAGVVASARYVHLTRSSSSSFIHMLRNCTNEHVRCPAGVIFNLLMQKYIACACDFHGKADLRQLRGEPDVEV